MAQAASDGFGDLTALGVECENCGRTRRLNRRQIQAMLGTGYCSLERLGRRLKCRPCAEQGKVSKNISITPYYRCAEVKTIAPL